MKIDYDSIHSEILLKSRPYKYLHEQININGVIKIKKTKLDFFAFITKMIISQQISDNVAEKIWRDYCQMLGCKNPNFQKIKIIKNPINNISKLKISKKKINYIISFYNAIKKKDLKITEIIKLNEKDLKYELCKFKGIGPWTCDMVLIFFLRRLNIFPENDLIINKTKQELFKFNNSKIDLKKEFSPYLSVFSLHLWKMSKRIL